MKKKYLLALSAIILIIIIAAGLTACNKPVEGEEQEKKFYTLHYLVETESTGYVVGAVEQRIEEGADGTEVFALAATGYRFVGWNDGMTDEKRQEKNVTADKTYTAQFEKISYVTVKYEASNGGAIVGDSLQTVEAGADCEAVEAVPSEGYCFVGWDDGITEARRQEKNVTADKTYTAQFEKISYVTVKYEASNGGAIVGDSLQMVEAGADCEAVEAVPSDGYCFVGWDDGIMEARRQDKGVEASQTFRADFEKLYEIKFRSENEKMGSIEGESVQSVIGGQMTTAVKAVPALGYKFTGWSNGVNEAELTVQAEAHETLIAYFSIDELSLPIIRIETKGGAAIESKEDYIDCVVTVENTDKKYEFSKAEATIKGRGNSTWGMPKKPYKLKFESKTDLFGNGAAKKWVLLANYADKSLLRSELAFEVGTALGLSYTTTTQAVELYLNGQYDGEYLICEQTEVGKTRVNIDKDLNPEDQAFLVELDSRAPEEGAEGLDWFYLSDTNGNQMPYAVKSPETDEDGYTEEVTQAIQNYLQAMFLLLKGDYETIQEEIDVESFAKTYIVYELFKSSDSGFSSWYLYRDSGGKLFSGPLWDFDLSCGNVHIVYNAGYPDKLWASVTNWWYRDLLEHEEFRQLVGEILHESQQTITDTINSVIELAKLNQDSYERNFQRWRILGEYVWPNPDEIVAIKTWEGQVAYVREFLEKSLAYLLKVYPVLN